MYWCSNRLSRRFAVSDFSNCMLLLIIQIENLRNWWNQQRYDKGSPKCINYGYDSTKWRNCSDITITHSSHRNDHTPNRCEEVIKNKLPIRLEVYSTSLIIDFYLSKILSTYDNHKIEITATTSIVSPGYLVTWAFKANAVF